MIWESRSEEASASGAPSRHENQHWLLSLIWQLAWQGFVPSAACMVTCWAFQVAEALLLAEINVYIRRRKNKDGDGRGGDGDLEVISVKSMAEETLGEWGGNVATAAYLFMSYNSMVAYASKSGEVLSRLVGVPEPVTASASAHRRRWNGRHGPREPAAHFLHDRYCLLKHVWKLMQQQRHRIENFTRRTDLIMPA
jgi:hypothetical protein